MIVILTSFLVVYLIETSLVVSLPEPFAFFPLVITLSVYLVQRFGLIAIGWWFVLEGFFMDFYGLSVVPFNVLAYIGGAIIVVTAFKSLFSNRSFYGVMATTVTTLVGISSIELIIYLFVTLVGTPAVSLLGLFEFFVWRVVLAGASLFFIYPISEWVLNAINIRPEKAFPRS